MPRYSFADFVLLPRQRRLLRAGQPVPLIPRYLDLLLFLIEHRRDAVHRRDIFDRVWPDVIVSDSALSQAIRTLRRTLGDDPRAPQFIRTVSRHGYQFVCADLLEVPDKEQGTAEAEDAAGRTEAGGQDTGRTLGGPERAGAAERVVDPAPADPTGRQAGLALAGRRDDAGELLGLLAVPAQTMGDREEQRDVAERLHALGTEDVLRRLDGHPRAAFVRALLRDTRHQVVGAGEVPLVGSVGGLAAAIALVALRVQRAARLVARRWIGGTLGSSLAGALAGGSGGALLAMAPGSSAPLTVAPVLAAIGAACGAVGGAGVCAGLCAAEALALSTRRPALVLAAAAGGAVAGGITEFLARWTLGAVFGLSLPIGGLLEGLVIGAGAGAGYALATRQVTAGLAAPRGRARTIVALVTGAGTAVAALLLSLSGLPLVGGTLHLLAQAAGGSQVLLTPLGRLLGEPEFGPLTRALISLAEGGGFGVGLVLGLARRA